MIFHEGPAISSSDIRMKRVTSSPAPAKAAVGTRELALRVHSHGLQTVHEQEVSQNVVIAFPERTKVPQTLT